MRRWLAAWILLALGVSLLALDMGGVFQFQVNAGGVSIEGPASVGAILVLLSAFVLLELL